MFTGIVETTGTILQKTDHGMTVERPASFNDLSIGGSICVCGVCLSLVEITPEGMRFDIIPETFARTTLGFLKEGDKVNLERSLAANGRFEGHVVQGHVEGVGTVTRNSDEGDGRGWLLSIRMPEALLPFVVQKGGIALDGISLTIAAVEGDVCSVALIPHTLEITNLGTKKPGDGINVETDILLRGLKRLMEVMGK